MGDQPLAQAATCAAENKHKIRSSLLSEGFENMIRKIKRLKTFAIIKSSGRKQKEKSLSVTIILKCGTKILLDRPYEFCGQDSVLYPGWTQCEERFMDIVRHCAES